MALVILGKTPCAISGKIITGEDNFLCFPPFPHEPHDPTAVCDDACVLRDEFEKWEFRSDTIKKMKEFWSLDYHSRETFTVVFEDDDYLLVRSKAEHKAQFLFLQHMFLMDIPRTAWRTFCTMLLNDIEVAEFSPYSNTTLCFRKETHKTEICFHSQTGWRDRIKLSQSEWSHFLSILAANEKLFE